jgi:tRNA (guanine10-N2)-methyltransferase
MPQFLLVFAQAHAEFRIPELRSVSELHGFDVDLGNNPDATRPFMVVGLESEEQANLLARRCVLIKSV